MFVAESLCCGTPVVGFKAGAPEQIAIKDYSNFVPWGDIGALTTELELWLSKSFDKANIKLYQYDRGEYRIYVNEEKKAVRYVVKYLDN